MSDFTDERRSVVTLGDVNFANAEIERLQEELREARAVINTIQDRVDRAIGYCHNAQDWDEIEWDGEPLYDWIFNHAQAFLAKSQ